MTEKLGSVQSTKPQSRRRLKAELERINGMSAAKVKPELQQWMVRRKKILAQMAEKEL